MSQRFGGIYRQERHELESDARLAAKKMAVCWVLFDTAHPHAVRSVELAKGGIGFAHDAIRLYTRRLEDAAPRSSLRGSLAGP